MFEYLLYMLIPTITPAAVLYFLGVKRFGLEGKIGRMAPFIIGLTLAMYLLGDTGVYILKPWIVDCSKTMGICPYGVPPEDLLFCFLVILNITLGTLVFSEIERRAKSKKEFLEYMLLMKK